MNLSLLLKIATIKNYNNNYNNNYKVRDNMGWISNIFSNSGVNVITSIGNVLDDLITTDEELALTDIQKKENYRCL